MSRSPTDQHPTSYPKLVGLSAQGMAWLEGKGTNDEWAYAPWQQPETAQQELVRRLLSLAAQDHQPKTFWLCADASVIAQWVQAVPARTASLQELHAVAGARATQLFGTPVQGSWLISADWKAQGSMVCSARASSWDFVHQEMAQQGIHIRWLSPLSLALSQLPQILYKDGSIALVIGAASYLMRVHNAQICSLRVLRWPESTNLADVQNLLTKEWRREVLRLNDAGTSVDLKLERLQTWLLLAPGMTTALHEGVGVDDPSWVCHQWTPAPSVPSVDWSDPAAIHAAWCGLQLHRDSSAHVGFASGVLK